MLKTTQIPPIEGYTIYDPVDPFENDVGPFYWRLLDDGSHHFVLLTAECHANAHGTIHGGLMMTMADLAIAATAKGKPDDIYVTVAFNCEFIASGFRGDLIEARAELVRRTGTMAFIRGKIQVGETDLFVYSGVMKRVGKRTACKED